MKIMYIKYLVIGLLMVIAAGLGGALKPTRSLAYDGQPLDLETMLPRQFGDWKMEQNNTGGIVNPQLSTELQEIYSQTLARAYVNPQGQRMMLSIAYGNNQNRKLQVHRPEVCYSAQGFSIAGMSKQLLSTPNGTVPAMQLIAHLGQRNEPITYWVMIGKRPVRGNVEQGLTRLQYGLSGVVPDGLLFRVSSISENTPAAFTLQQQFISDLLQSVTPATRSRLAGLV